MQAVSSSGLKEGRVRIASAVAVVAFLFPGPVHAAVPEYEALRSARVSDRAVEVRDFTLTRDAMQFTFASGSFHLLEEASGRTFGAVFVGDGSYSLSPATAGELRHLRLVTSDPKLEALTDRFENAVLFFSDTTEREIFAAGTEQQRPAPQRAVQAYDEHMRLQKREFQLNIHLRLLADMLNDRPSAGGVFVAAVDGRRLAPALYIVDPLGIGNFAAQYAFFGGEEVAFLSSDQENGGFWYLSTYRDQAREGHGKALLRRAEALHYDVRTTIGSRSAINGETTIRLRALQPGLRVLPIHLLPKLRLTHADTGSNELQFVQEDVRLGAWKRLFQDEAADGDAALVFPAPLPVGEPVEVRIEYKGTDVLQPVGVESYSVRARESWYPNLHAFIDTATYRLTFRHPRSMNLVAVGTLQSETVEQGDKVSVWSSTEPMRVAGFNYGRFEKRSRRDEVTGVAIDVYTNRSWQKKAEDVMADTVNALRTGHAFFGPPPHATLSVTQQSEWFFGQSWPTLVYLPTISLTTQSERVMGFERAGPRNIADLNEFVDSVGWHEVAHQWWGHKVGWQSYRDQWLSEGFSEFTAALALQFTRNMDQYTRYWDRRRSDITERRGGTVANHNAGAMTQGWRLGTKWSPGAPKAMIYYKGAFVLHMLRMLMWEPASDRPDTRFIAMMRDFIDTHAGGAPSTRDFQSVVERHIVPEMNATGDGRMDWFFEQWVYGTEIPSITSDLRAESTGDGRYRLTGTVSQSKVSDRFLSVVPLYADFGGGSYGRVGMIRLAGNETRTVDVTVQMQRPPRRVVVNLRNDVLTAR
jgi:GNAT superfamily N-acetyltransferase